MLLAVIKNKKIAIFLVVLTILVALFFLIKSMLPIVTSVGLQNSFSIQDSKEKNSFMAEYLSFQLNINDTLRINVKEFYSEHQLGIFSFKNSDLKINREKCQVVLITKENLDSLEMGLDWGVEYPFEFTSSHTLICRFDSPVPPDTIDLIFKKRNETNEIIQSFKLSTRR